MNLNYLRRQLFVIISLLVVAILILSIKQFLEGIFFIYSALPEALENSPIKYTTNGFLRFPKAASSNYLPEHNKENPTFVQPNVSDYDKNNPP